MGADLSAKLLEAVNNRSNSMVKQLLQDKTIRQIANANGNEALRLAAKNNDKEIVKMLLQLPVVSKNVPDKRNEALAWMIFHSKDDGNGPDYFDEVYSLLFRVKEVQKHAADNKNELLKLAITNGHLPITQQLLKIPAVCEHAADNENELLKLAITNGHLPIVKELLKSPAGEHAAKNENELVELARRSENYKGEHNSIVKQLKISAKQHAADTKKDTQEAKTLIFSDTTNKPESLPKASEPKEPLEIPNHPKTH